MTRLRCVVLALGLTQPMLPQSEPMPAPEQMQPWEPTSTVVIRESSEIRLPASNVSAAYSLDPLIAEAQAEEGQIRIWGRSPGRALIVVVQASDFSTSSIEVTVSQAPPILPDRLWSGVGAENQNANGYYEARVSSDPLQMNEVFDYRAGWMQLHFTNVVVPGATLPGSSPVRFPFSYLRLIGSRWKVTLLDENVQSSPLSVTSTLLRGVHFSAGGFTIHAGYTSVAGFESLFLPAYKQLIFGSTWAHHVSANSEIGATGYFLQQTPPMLLRRGRGLATVFFKRHTLHGSDFFAEAGISKGIGGAVSATHNTDSDQFYLFARYRPMFYAASDTDNLNGLQSETRWTHIFGENLVSALSGSRNDIFTGSGRQTIQIASGSLRYRASKTISLSTGASVSHFSENQTLFADVRRFAIPLSLTYDRPSFGAGAQYEYSQTSHAFSPGQAYRGSARWSHGHFQMSAAGGLATQSLGVDSVYSTFPGLTVALAQLGVAASTGLDQLTALLRERAFLNSLGIAPNATVELVPRNRQAGLNLSWRAGRQIVELNSNYNLQAFLTQRSTVALETARYRRGIGNGSELITSLTLLDTLAPYPRSDVVWEIGIRHQLGGNPFQRARARGDISGTVRMEEASGIRPVEGVEITLDGERRTASDGEGHYRFPNLPSGSHTIQITFRSSRPFWYSSPSRVSTKADSIVDFGIVYPSAQVFGYVMDDSGMAVPGIGVVLKNPQGTRNIISDQQGRFVVAIPRAGTYVMSINPETLPDGYATEELQPLSISIEEGDSKKVSFTVLSIRALTGLIERYDVEQEGYIPVRGALIQIPELHRQTTTGADGRYLFREMPSGAFTILVNGEPYGRVQMGAAPQLLRYNIKMHGDRVAAAPLP